MNEANFNKERLFLKNALKYLLLTLAAAAIVLVFTKPNQQDYLDRITAEYAHIHPGMELTKDDIVEMGSTQYESQVVYSSYTYKFGRIEVKYWGIFGLIFSNGYETEGEEENVTKTGTLSIN